MEGAIGALLVLVGGLLSLDYAAVRWGADSRPPDLGRGAADQWWPR